MTFDFPALQTRVNKIIASGSTGTNAALLVYPVSAATDTQGGTVFDGTGIGTDVFLYISGSNIAKTVFGGDIHVSGNVFVSGNLEVTGSGGGGGGGGISAVDGLGAGWHADTFTPLALYDFDGDGSDISGNELHLTASGGTVFDEANRRLADGGGFLEPANATVSSRKVWDNSSFRYDGQNIGGPGNWSNMYLTGAMSAIAWCRPDSISSTRYLAVWGFNPATGGDEENSLWLFGFDAGKFRYSHQSGSTPTTETFVATDASLVASEWAHVAFTRAADGKSLAFYKDGHLETTTTMSFAPDNGTSSSLAVGEHNNGFNAFDGRIAGLMFVGEELSHEQIYSDYNLVRRGLINKAES